jgi:hypothetical protein
VTLINYAYDITGAQIPAGFRGKALDGDEFEFERSGLPALSLGAAGVRRLARDAPSLKLPPRRVQRRRIWSRAPT